MIPKLYKNNDITIVQILSNLGINMNNKILFTVLLSATVFALSACAPEVGSKAWCDDMNEKSKSDWTASEAGEYAKNCVFKQKD